MKMWPSFHLMISPKTVAIEQLYQTDHFKLKIDEESFHSKPYK